MNRKMLFINIGFFIAGIVLCVCVSRIKPRQESAMPVQTKGEVTTNDLLEERKLSKDNDLDIPDNTVEEEHDYQKLNTDWGYKILYGEWLVTKTIGENYRIDSQDVSDVIGKKFWFSASNSHFFYYNEEVSINYPQYEIITIPLDDDTTYFPYMPTMKEMGILGDYAVMFVPESAECGYDMYFIIKDDETLMMYYKETYLELKRTKYIPNYEFYYHAV